MKKEIAPSIKTCLCSHMEKSGSVLYKVKYLFISKPKKLYFCRFQVDNMKLFYLKK